MLLVNPCYGVYFYETEIGQDRKDSRLFPRMQTCIFARAPLTPTMTMCFILFDEANYYVYSC